MVHEKDPKSALITGATGFVGSHLAHRLAKEGWRVHVILRPTSSLTPFQRIKQDLTLHCHDGSTEGMLDIFAVSKPQIVFHLASLFLGHHTAKNIIPLINNNLLFGTQLVQAMVEHECFFLVNTGTSWQHYCNHDYSPVCLYAATKQAFETIIQFYLETTPLKTVTLKLFDTYGPYDHRNKLFSLLRKSALRQELLDMSPGGQLIDLVYIDDVIDAFMLTASRLLNQEVSGFETYAVSSGTPIPLKELVETYVRESQQNITIRWGGKPYRPREVMIPWNEGQILPGWRPRVKLPEGIREMELEYASRDCD